MLTATSTTKLKTVKMRPSQLARLKSSLTVSVIFVAICVTGALVLPQTDASSTTGNLRDPIVWDAQTLYKNQIRYKRSTTATTTTTTTSSPESTQSAMVDACRSKMEIITPYYATNSKGKLRTVINSELMQQAIQVETCARSQNVIAGRCSAKSDCGCEQKYKWHRLLVLDPKDAGANKSLFMDWFLFPSSCVCRCKSSAPSDSRQQLLRSIRVR